MKAETLHSLSAVTVTALPSDIGSPRQRQRRAAGDRDDALPLGTRLSEFEILGVLGAGGFGIVYLAMDHTLRRTVAVKEHLPLDFARRSDNWEVVPRTEADAAAHAAGLQAFMREAQLLAGFDHPSLVKVHRFWKANGTAYMVMPHYPGRTLKEVQRTTGALRDEPSLRRLLHPLLSALEVLHDASVYHRDISPDNIVVLPDGKPILLDFGSARHVVNDRTQALTAMFKPSFAAIEQYGDVPGLRQGAWTDLYALAGVMHFMITGSGPVPAALRAVNDAQPRLAASAAGKGGLSRHLLEAIDWALAVRPDQRPQSVRSLREVLDGLVPAPSFGDERVQADAAIAAPPAPAEAAMPAVGPGPDRRVVRRTAALVGVSLALCAAVWARHEPRTPTQTSAAPPPTVAPASDRTSGGSAAAPVPAPRVAALARVDAGPAAVVANPAPLRKEIPSAGAPRLRSTTPLPPKPAAASRETGPREACGDRNFISMASCMDRQCREPVFQAHAQCEPFRRYAESRRQAELAR